MGDRLSNVRRLNPWYGRTAQSRRGDWVLRAGPENDGIPHDGPAGWYHWVWRPRWIHLAS